MTPVEETSHKRPRRAWIGRRAEWKEEERGIQSCHIEYQFSPSTSNMCEGTVQI